MVSVIVNPLKGTMLGKRTSERELVAGGDADGSDSWEGVAAAGFVVLPWPVTHFLLAKEHIGTQSITAPPTLPLPSLLLGSAECANAFLKFSTSETYKPTPASIEAIYCAGH